MNYFKNILRNISKNKTQVFVGIFGLSFGLTFFVPVLYWMSYEFSYDGFYPNAESIYRIYAVEKQSAKVNELIPGILEKKLHDYFPEVDGAAGFYSELNNCKTLDDRHIQLNTLITDSSFFSVFTPEFISGDTKKPLQSLFNIVLTETAAIALFGSVDKAIGQSIQSTYYFYNPPYVVTAVIKDPPPNTNLPFTALLYHEILAGISASPEEMQWEQFDFQLYIKFHSKIDVDYFAKRIYDFPSRINANSDIVLKVIHISDVRHGLNNNVLFSLNFIRLFFIVGVLILISVVFNFLNINFDHFLIRNREWRQRMIHGASKGLLVQQMLFEMFFLLFISLLISCCFVAFAYPVIFDLLSIEERVTKLIIVFVSCWILIIILVLFVSLISFSQLVNLVAKNSSKRNIIKSPVLRHIAVTLQLIVSIILIVSSGVVLLQIQYANHKEMGFRHTGIIQLYGLPPYMKTSIRAALIREIEAIPHVKSVATSNYSPHHNVKMMEMITSVEWQGRSLNEKTIFNIITTDNCFAETLGLKMRIGEWYDNGSTNKIVLNEEAVQLMGLHDPIGAIIRLSIDDVDHEDAMEEYRVVGVVNNFHALSLHNRIQPTIFRQTLSGSNIAMDNIIYINVTPGQEKESIQQILSILPTIDPSFANLRIMTLDDLFESFNYSERLGLKLFTLLSIVCLLVSLFGIYAIATGSTLQRRKEIAIRKVVGAKASDIVYLFFHDFTLQVIVASCIGLPIAYLMMSYWLQGYAYRTNIPLWLLAGTIVVVVVVVLCTVFKQVLNAANSDPAKVIKKDY